MSTKSFDNVDRLRFDLQRINRDYKNLSKYIGNRDKDDVGLRRKFTMARDRFNNTCRKIEGAMKANSQIPGSTEKANDMWSELRNHIGKEKSEFERMDRDVRAKEKACPLDDDDMNMNNNDADSVDAALIPSVGGGSVDRMQQQGFKQLDVAELNTEEHIQRDKLEAVVQIEQDVNEVKSLFQEFNGELKQQQVGLDRMEKNVDNSVVKVEKGVTELKEANKLQKSGRKNVWCLLLLLIVAAGLLVVVYMVMKNT